MVIPSQVSRQSKLGDEGVETRRQIPRGILFARKRYSPAYKPEKGHESDSEMHNRLVPGSSPGRPTKLTYFRKRILWLPVF